MWQWETTLTEGIKSYQWRITCDYWWQALGESLFLILLLCIVIIPWFEKKIHWSERLMISLAGIGFGFLALIMILTNK